VKVRVYVEGGGRKRKSLDDCRRGFGQLFERVIRAGRPPRVVACGDRASAFRDFRRDVQQGKEGFLILLVDSEGPVDANVTTWAYLKTRDRWNRPRGVRDDQAHLMVQCMESWFLADQEALRKCYGQDLRVDSLPRRTNLEEIEKRHVEQALQHATRPTQKGRYHETGHAFDLLALIDPTRVRQASGYAWRLFEVLEQRAGM